MVRMKGSPECFGRHVGDDGRRRDDDSHNN